MVAFQLDLLSQVSIPSTANPRSSFPRHLMQQSFCKPAVQTCLTLNGKWNLPNAKSFSFLNRKMAKNKVKKKEFEYFQLLHTYKMEKLAGSKSWSFHFYFHRQLQIRLLRASLSVCLSYQSLFGIFLNKTFGLKWVGKIVGTCVKLLLMPPVNFDFGRFYLIL